MYRCFVLGCCALLVLGAAGIIAACSSDTSGTGAILDASSDVSSSGDGSSDTTVPPTDSPSVDGPSPEGSPTDAGDGGSKEASLQDGPLETGPDVQAEAAADAGSDADAACTGVICNGQCTESTDCHGCSGAPLLCGPSNQCVTDCQGCSDSNEGGLPIECFACDSSHQNPLGSCQYGDAGAYCLNGDYSNQYTGGPGYRCGCDDVSACPGATQVCVPLGNLDASFCLTCGEATLANLQGQSCKGGGACQTSQANCQ
jgi:hypothetical protein